MMEKTTQEVVGLNVKETLDLVNESIQELGNIHMRLFHMRSRLRFLLDNVCPPANDAKVPYDFFRNYLVNDDEPTAR